MALALAEASRAADHGDVPVGCVVLSSQGQLIAVGHNERERAGDPTAHAEIVALRRASMVIGHWRLLDTTVYVTLEPCAMCAGALVLSRVDRLVFGARDPKAGFCGSLGNLVADSRLNHRPQVSEGVGGEEAARLLRTFFARLRERREVL